MIFDALCHYIVVSIRYLCTCCVRTWMHGSHIILSTQMEKHLPISTLFEFLTNPVSAACDIYIHCGIFSSVQSLLYLMAVLDPASCLVIKTCYLSYENLYFTIEW